MTRWSEFFATSYAEARSGFLAACERNGATLKAHRHPRSAPDGEAIFLDEARFGASDASRIFFLLSGTHGIEGFCGSGIQRFLLADGLAARVPPGTALVMLHAVNPFGFAWLRRVNEDNVDLNRNFLDHGARHPVNPDYDALYDVLNPPSFDDATIKASQERMRRFEAEFGFEAAYRAMSGGQYVHPHAIQFGGREPVWSNRTLREIWARHAGAAEAAALVDLHSGLGTKGEGILLQTASEASAAGRLSKAWWPEVLRFEPAAGTNAALASGLIGPAFVEALPHASSVGLVLEFGTHPIQQVALAIQADNWLHQQGQFDSEQGRAIQRQMRAAFFIEEDEWQEKVCTRAKDVVDRGLAGIAAA